MRQTKIEKLTPEQERRLVEFRDEWFRIGSSCKPADRATAERAITAMYDRINKPAPHFVWTQSPATALLVISALRNGNSLRDSLRDSLGASLWDSLRASLRASLWDSLGDSLWGSLRDSLWGSLRASLWDSLWGSLWDSLWGPLWDSLGASLRDSLRGSLRDSRFCGSSEAYWIAFYAYSREVLGVRYELSGDLDLWADVARSCGWWWPYDGLCIVSDRPEQVRWSNDPVPVLHCADGPALRYRDGWEIYSWRGTRVPREWVMQSDTIDPRLALTHENTEQRRALAEILGWDRIIAQLEPRTVDTDKDPQIGTLLEVDLPDSGLERFLRVECGTGRTFVLPVPPDVTTALEANAWTYGLSAQEYRPEVRT